LNHSLKPSRYNLFVNENESKVVFFNSFSGAILRLDGPSAHDLTKILCDPYQRIDPIQLNDNLINELIKGRFLLGIEVDELHEIRERYWNARGETPAVLTITTTMDCNLGCYYCYEERSGSSLASVDIPPIIELAKGIIEKNNRKTLHVDWYGGEPLLNVGFIQSASIALQNLCKNLGVVYAASIISNGSEWPEDVRQFITANKIRQVQISFDGLKKNHDKRRRYREGYGDQYDSSFSKAVLLVDQLVSTTRVDLRFNIDRANAHDIIPFIDFAKQRGWFSAAYPAVFQPARLASYSQASEFMRKHELSLEEFDNIRTTVRNELVDIKIEESEVPDGFPHPKTSVCAALSANSIVVGAEGLTYRCGLQVGENNRAVGNLNPRFIATDKFSDNDWWRNFDPTTLPTCSICSFLPICWGGCPKKHLEDDRHAIQEQGKYWRHNLGRLIAKAANFEFKPEMVILDNQQFR
jgi:uncharacterized protein